MGLPINAPRPDLDLSDNEVLGGGDKLLDLLRPLKTSWIFRVRACDHTDGFQSRGAVLGPY